jgi:glyoxylate/hydroxypyruvate reductase A
MALLIDIKHADWLSDEDLRDQLQPFWPEADIRVGSNPGDPSEIDMLTVSTYLPGEALNYPNLQLIQKTGAGVNNILADEGLPEHIRITRLETHVSGNEMAEYALAYVLQEQRHIRYYREHQARSEWAFHPPRKSEQTTVGIMGLGRIGKLIAKRFVENRFQVCGWSRSLKNLENVTCYQGRDGLDTMLGKADYVVSVLPSTPETRSLFDYDLFSQFKPESFYINVGRGDQVDESGLIKALDEGLLSGAILDVMSVEPLPSDHPLWLHHKVQLTPHISGFHLGDAVNSIIDNYRRLQNSEPLLNEINRSTGY